MEALVQQSPTIIADWVLVLPMLLALMGAAALVMRRSDPLSALLAASVTMTSFSLPRLPDLISFSRSSFFSA